MTIFWLALKNLNRNRFWTIITVGITAIALSSIFLSFVLIGGLGRSLEIGRERLGTDLVVFPTGKADAFTCMTQTGKPELFYMNKGTVDKVRNIPGVAKASPELYLQTLSKGCCSLGVPFRLIGFDARTDFAVTPWLKKLRLDKLADNEVIVGADVPAAKGETIKILTRDFKVAGILERTGMGIDKTIYMPLAVAREIGVKSLELKLKADEISSILVKVDAGYNIAEVRNEIMRRLPSTGVMENSQVLRSVKVIFDKMSLISFFIFAVTLTLSLISILAVFYAQSEERGVEIGILRSLGARKASIFSLIILESVCAALAGGALGVVVSGFLVYDFNVLISRSLPFPFVLSAEGMLGIGLGCILLSLLLGLLGALYPAWRSANLDPFEAIRHGA
jgi:putative ABC transport system permease protein